MFKSIWPRRRRCEPIPPGLGLGERTPSLGRSSSSDDWHGPGPDAMPPAPSQLHCSTTASACRSAACGDRFRLSCGPNSWSGRPGPHGPLYWRADRPAAARACDAERAVTAAGRREQGWACSRSGSGVGQVAMDLPVPVS